MRRNTASVDNGQTGIIKDIDPGRRLTVVLDGHADHSTIVLEPAYAERYLEHAYAATITLTEGLTYDYAHALAGDTLAREAAYVALTRNRLACQLHDWHQHDHHRPLAIRTERQALTDRLEQARAEHLAIESDPLTLERDAVNLEHRAAVWRDALDALAHGEPVPDAWHPPLDRLRQDLNDRSTTLPPRVRAVAMDLATRLHRSPTEPRDLGTASIRGTLERACELAANVPINVDTERSRATLDQAIELTHVGEIPRYDPDRNIDTVAALDAPARARPTNVEHGIDLGL
jgi:hypothetical protein